MGRREAGNDVGAGVAIRADAGARLAIGTRLAIEEERDFCLRSLRDLETERAAGDIDPAEYEALRDSYVARAAAALRDLDRAEQGGGADPADPASAADPAGAAGAVSSAGSSAGESAVEAIGGGSAPETPGSAPPCLRWPWHRRVLVALGVAAVAAGAAWAVVASSATRLPGQEITGQALGPVAVAQSLQQAQQAVDRGDDLTAVKDYQKILNGDPNQPQALTGEGWLLAQTQQPTVLQQGLTMLSAAERAAPTYAPAHVYRGIALLSERDYAGAIPELKWYLAHNPDPQLAPRVRAALQQAQAGAAAAQPRG